MGRSWYLRWKGGTGERGVPGRESTEVTNLLKGVEMMLEL